MLAAVAAGVWQDGPWGGAGEPAPPATTEVPVPSPPSAGLPWDDRFHWRETDLDGALGATYEGWRDRCAWSGFLTETGHGAVRYYAGRDGALAVWETVSYGSARQARKTAERLLDEGVCGYGARTAGGAADGLGVADTGGPPGEQGPARLHTAVDGDRLGVLRVLVGPPGEDGAAAGAYPYAPPPDDGTADCLAGLLDGAEETAACRAPGGPWAGTPDGHPAHAVAPPRRWSGRTRQGAPTARTVRKMSGSRTTGGIRMTSR